MSPEVGYFVSPANERKECFGQLPQLLIQNGKVDIEYYHQLTDLTDMSQESLVVAGGDGTVRLITEWFLLHDQPVPHLLVAAEGTSNNIGKFARRLGATLNVGHKFGDNPATCSAVAYHPGMLAGKVFLGDAAVDSVSLSIGTANEKLRGSIEGRLRPALAAMLGVSRYYMQTNPPDKQVLDMYFVLSTFGGREVLPQQDYHSNEITRAHVSGNSRVQQCARLPIACLALGLGLPDLLAKVTTITQARMFNIGPDHDQFRADGDLVDYSADIAKTVFRSDQLIFVTALIYP